MELAKELGHDRLFVLDSGEYGAGYIRDLRAYAKLRGVAVVGVARFDPEQKSVSALVRRVVRSRPESIAIVDVLSEGSAALVRGLRAALGPDVAISAPDGLLVSEFAELPGSAAEGVYVTNYGIPNDRLPPRGRQFLREFSATNGGDPGPDYGAAYGAQAVEILLDAIARSDGTRRSVLDEVGRTVVTNGILGEHQLGRAGRPPRGADSPIFRVQDGDVVVVSHRRQSSVRRACERAGTVTQDSAMRARRNRAVPDPTRWRR